MLISDRYSQETRTNGVLASQGVSPRSPSQNEKVVDQDKDVEELIRNKDLPRPYEILSIVKRGNAESELSQYECGTGANGQSTDSIRGSARVALSQSPGLVIGWEADLVLTNPFFSLDGARIEVQWYWPPAVGYRAESSAIENAVAV